MNIVITEWALQSYLELKHQQVFSHVEYWGCLRPDVERLRGGIPSPDPHFSNPGFWGPITDKSGNTIPHGFKMKWHNLGPGKVQLRLCIRLDGATAYLCRAFVKSSDAVDKRQAARFKIHSDDITAGRVIIRGQL